MYASVFLNADVSADSMKTTEIFDRFLTLQKAGDPNAVRTLDPYAFGISLRQNSSEYFALALLRHRASSTFIGLRP